ncbi:MAG: hypothetical protein KKF56_03315 [Nanoarchaeota archaeon]|nr:hypothetical protein [Nanoarchaeota archaeon]
MDNQDRPKISIISRRELISDTAGEILGRGLVAVNALYYLGIVALVGGVIAYTSGGGN